MYYGNLSFMNKYFKDKGNWKFVFKSTARKGSLVLDPTGKVFLARGKKNSNHPALLHTGAQYLLIKLLKYFIIQCMNYYKERNFNFFESNSFVRTLAFNIIVCDTIATSGQRAHLLRHDQNGQRYWQVDKGRRASYKPV
jgi:hypothetical protein